MSASAKITSSPTYKKSVTSYPVTGLLKKAAMAAHNDRSSASFASNDSSSDPLESDFSEGSCEEEPIRCRVALKNREFSLDDFQIQKTIGKFN